MRSEDESFIAGPDCEIDEGAVLGYFDGGPRRPTILGRRCRIRHGSIIYSGVIIGDDFICGHNVLIREDTRVGNRVLVGTNSVLEGSIAIGDGTRIQSSCFLPPGTLVGANVFIGPGAVLTNDKYPLRQRASYGPAPPIVEDGVTIGAGATILPGVRIGSGSFIGAGAVVTRDVACNSLVTGVPGRAVPLPDWINEPNAPLGEILSSEAEHIVRRARLV